MHGQNPKASFMGLPLLLTHVDQVTGAHVPGTSSIPYRDNMWHDPSDGWAVPLVVGSFYDAAFPNMADFTSVTLEATGLLPGEHAYVRFKHVTDWAYWKVWAGGGPLKIPSVKSLPGSGASTGSSYHDVQNRSLTVLLSGLDETEPAAVQVIRLKPEECPRIGCPVPPPPVSAEKEPFIRLWSNATQWPGGTLPEAGGDVKVPFPWNLKLDIEPPVLELLDIRGSLFFDDSRPSTVLAAAAIRIFGGELAAGSPTRPFPGRATIHLVGDRTSSSIDPVPDDSGRSSDRVSGGPKVLLVLGKLSLHGVPSLVSWARLGATAAAGSSSAVMSEDVDWVPGDEVVLAARGHNPDEAEVVELSAVSGRHLTFTTPLKHTHFGAPAAAATGGSAVVVEVGETCVSVTRECRPLSFGVLSVKQGCREIPINDWLQRNHYHSKPGSRTLPCTW